MTIEVWAPRAARVRLRRPGQEDVELTAGDAGWWRADVALANGDEYGFVLGDATDAPARPDLDRVTSAGFRGLRLVEP